jgi:hypothetical protein
MSQVGSADAGEPGTMMGGMELPGTERCKANNPAICNIYLLSDAVGSCRWGPLMRVSPEP